MTRDEFENYTAENPVIPAVNSDYKLEKALESDSQIIYVLYGTVVSIHNIVEKIRRAGKKSIIHVDLIKGLSSKEEAVDFILKYIKPDGIISTKPNIVKYANDKGILTIQRFYIVDVLAYRNVEKYIKIAEPDVVEFMPISITKAMKYLMEDLDKPVVASGLALDKHDIMEALKIGVNAVSTTNEDLWDC